MDCSSQTAIRQGQRSHSQGRYKRCQTWQHHRGKEVQFHGGKMGYGPDLLREGQTRRDCEVWDHIATTQDKSNDPKHQRTTAEREAHWGGWRTAKFDKTEGSVAVLMHPEYSLACQLIRERSREDWKQWRNSSSITCFMDTWSNWPWHE